MILTAEWSLAKKLKETALGSGRVRVASPRVMVRDVGGIL